MKILITGGTGFIGQNLINQRLLAGDQIYCLTRNVEKVSSLFSSNVVALTELPATDTLIVDAVINLAGEPILDKRWSASRKKILFDSRVSLTKELVNWISLQSDKPSTFISGSAIGYYGSDSNAIFSEESQGRLGFTHDLCNAWEEAANEAKTYGVRVCTIRTGIVLGDGGALTKMLTPFKLGLGGPIGDGQQWMSWIHIDDQVDVIEMLLTHSQLEGVYNLTAPEAVTNREFSTSLGEALHRPAVLPMPRFMMQIILGEGAELLVEGQKVYPQKLLDLGYEFKYEQLQDAFEAVFKVSDTD